MNTLHEQFLKKEWYARWHATPLSTIVHLAIFILVCLFSTASLLQAIERGEVIMEDALAMPFEAPLVAVPVELPEPTEILVKFTRETNENSRAEVKQKEKLKEKKTIPQIAVDVLSVDETDTPEEVVRRLKVKYPKHIEFAEVNMPFAPSYTPNDPSLPNEWHIEKIAAQTAWDSAKGSPITVAILDSGVNCAHGDLSANCILPGYNTVSNNTETADVNGHGTKTSGTAAAAGDNGIGVAGVAYQARILPIRISNTSDGYAYWSDAAEGVTYAADHGAKVVSLSYEGYLSSTIASAAEYLRGKGGLFVTAAGNSGTRITTTGNSPSVIVVSATGSGDSKASWSNYGALIDMAAPGVSIYTTTNSGGYASVSGTSFSTPVIAGTIALIWSANPTLSNTQVENILFSSGADLGVAGWDEIYGWGRVNAGAAIAKALATSGTSPVPDTIPPSIPQGVLAETISSNKINISWTPSIDNVDVIGYDIYRDGTKLTTVSLAKYEDTAIVPEKTYTYAIAAFDKTGNRSALSAPVNITTPAALFALTTWSITTKTKNSATLEWSTNKLSTGVVRYGTSSNALTLETPAPIAAVSQKVVLQNLRARTTYYYQITATAGDGTVISSTISSFKTTSGK